MIQVVPQPRILFAPAPVDFRCDIDGLAAVCRAALGEDLMIRAVFVFRNRHGDGVVALRVRRAGTRP